jgi:hypothetical protein
MCTSLLMSFFLVDVPDNLISLPVLFSKQATGKFRVTGVFWVRRQRWSVIDLVVQLDCVCVSSISQLSMQLRFNGTLSKIENIVCKPMHWCTFLRHIAYRCTEYFSAHVTRSSENPWFTLFRGAKGCAAKDSGPSWRSSTHEERQMIVKIPFFRYGHRLRFIRHAERLAEKTCLPLAASRFQITIRQVKR